MIEHLILGSTWGMHIRQRNPVSVTFNFVCSCWIRVLVAYPSDFTSPWLIDLIHLLWVLVPTMHLHRIWVNATIIRKVHMISSIIMRLLLCMWLRQCLLLINCFCCTVWLVSADLINVTNSRWRYHLLHLFFLYYSLRSLLQHFTLPRWPDRHNELPYLSLPLLRNSYHMLIELPFKKGPAYPKLRWQLIKRRTWSSHASTYTTYL